MHTNPKASRIIFQRPDVVIDRSLNSGTIVCSSAFLRGAAPVDARSIIARHFEQMRAALASRTEPGVVIFAFDQRAQPIGEAWLAASESHPRAMVIGRHSECDLVVPSPMQEVSLRHVLVLVRRPAEGGIRARLFDLATPLGLVDESGRRLRGLVSNGPVFLRMGDVDLAILPTGTGLEDAKNARDAYEALPVREFIDVRKDVALLPPPAARHGETTFVGESLPVCVGPEPLCFDDERPVAVLGAQVDHMEVRQAVGAAALRRGVLLGRYERCHVRFFDAAHQASRVHALVLEEGGDCCVIETASTNGMSIDGRPAKLAIVRDRVTIEMGGCFVFVHRLVQPSRAR